MKLVHNSDNNLIAVATFRQAAELFYAYMAKNHNAQMPFTFQSDIDEGEDTTGWHGIALTKPFDFDVISLGYYGGDFEYQSYHLLEATNNPEDHGLDKDVVTTVDAIASMIKTYVYSYSYENENPSPRDTICVQVPHGMRQMAETL